MSNKVLIAQPLLYSVADAAQLLGVGKHTVRTAINDGHLPLVQIGHKWLIHVTALRAFAKRGTGSFATTTTA